MKRILAFLSVTLPLVLGVGRPIQANGQFPALPAGPMEVISTRPAATLLLPYFEVELSRSNGMTTVFSINNASATAALAHVTVWSELSIPVLAFDVYLTGYDVQAINMRDILNGVLPRTASDGQDPTDTISPQGPFSQDINFASCNAILPQPQLDSTYVTHLQNSLTGKPSPIFGGLCSAFDSGTRARGYVTVDTVNQCSILTPRDPGYFISGGNGVATNQNLLWGDFYFINRRRIGAGWISRGGPLVHIRADATDAATSTPGNYTFYGRYVAWTAADNRQPLGTTFAARYLNGGAFQTPSSFIVWRDAKVIQDPFICPAILGVRPAWAPLGQEGIVVFDEQENVDLPIPPPVFPPPPQGQAVPFRSEAQRVEVGGPDFPVAFDFGWTFLNLNTAVPLAGPNPPADPATAQAWVYVIYDTTGRFSTGRDASVLDSALDANHTVPGL